jgi:hypothetical protein
LKGHNFLQFKHEIGPGFQKIDFGIDLGLKCGKFQFATIDTEFSVAFQQIKGI